MKDNEMIFDLQLFADGNEIAENEIAENNETAASDETETKTEQEPIPAEFDGLSEETARAAMAEMKATNDEGDKPESIADTDGEASQPGAIPYARFKEKVDETNELKAKLAEYENRFAEMQQTQQQSPQQAVTPVQRQQPQVQQQQTINPQFFAQVEQIARQNAMQMTNMTQEDVDSLNFAEDDDPRKNMWQTALNMARNDIFANIRQEQTARQQRATEFLRQHQVNVNNFNNYAFEQTKMADFPAIKNFAANEYFGSLPAAEQEIVSDAYARVLDQTASRQDTYLIMKYFEEAKNAYRSKNNAPQRNVAAPKKPSANSMPRAGSIRGGGGGIDGAVTAETLLSMANTMQWEQIPQKYRDMLMGITPIGNG